MKVCHSIETLRADTAAWRRGGLTVALVPTMGNLHSGHIALVERARTLADRVVVSVFVNPIQFGPSEDRDAYPRTPEADMRKLDAANVDIVFMPDAGEVYPDGQAQAVVQVRGMDDILCGASRPGHFSGVATIVSMLFNMVVPNVAVFGRKDYQQLIIVRRMAAGLFFPVAIVGVDTVREPDGLAMSSRNRYLSSAERERAPALYHALCTAAAQLRAGQRDFSSIEANTRHVMEDAGFKTDYVAIRHPDDLGTPAAQANRYIVLGAGWLGSARLIDNVSVAL